MKSNKTPRPYEEWRKDPVDRAEDAAYTFGYYLIKHCRNEAINKLPSAISKEEKEIAVNAVDIALHNVTDMLEGFWKLDSGPGHTVELVLNVHINNDDGDIIESINVSPCKLDLPIGYWKWAKDGEFR